MFQVGALGKKKNYLVLVILIVCAGNRTQVLHLECHQEYSNFV